MRKPETQSSRARGLDRRTQVPTPGAEDLQLQYPLALAPNYADRRRPASQATCALVHLLRAVTLVGSRLLPASQRDSASLGTSALSCFWVLGVHVVMSPSAVTCGCDVLATLASDPGVIPGHSYSPCSPPATRVTCTHGCPGRASQLLPAAQLHLRVCPPGSSLTSSSLFPSCASWLEPFSLCSPKGQTVGFNKLCQCCR